MGRDVLRFGAAPRPSGGIVIATESYRSAGVDLHLVPEAFDAPLRTLRVNTPPLDGSQQLAVLVTAGSPERAHLVLSTSASQLQYLVVDLGSGAVTRETVEL